MVFKKKLSNKLFYRYDTCTSIKQTRNNQKINKQTYVPQIHGRAGVGKLEAPLQALQCSLWIAVLPVASTPDWVEQMSTERHQFALVGLVENLGRELSRLGDKPFVVVLANGMQCHQRATHGMDTSKLRFFFAYLFFIK